VDFSEEFDELQAFLMLAKPDVLPLILCFQAIMMLPTVSNVSLVHLPLAFQGFVEVPFSLCF
jgi:hypothetical protein